MPINTSKLTPTVLPTKLSACHYIFQSTIQASGVPKRGGMRGGGGGGAHPP